jgi:hypothetical protein
MQIDHRWPLHQWAAIITSSKYHPESPLAHRTACSDTPANERYSSSLPGYLLKAHRCTTIDLTKVPANCSVLFCNFYYPLSAQERHQMRYTGYLRD